MFGFGKIKLKYLTSFLKGKGLNLTALADQFMPMILQKIKDFQQKAGAQIIATQRLDDSGNFIILALYKKAMGSEGDYELWMEYPLDDINAVIQKIEESIQNDNSTEIDLENFAGLSDLSGFIGSATAGHDGPAQPGAADEPDPYDFAGAAGRS